MIRRFFAVVSLLLVPTTLAHDLRNQLAVHISKAHIAPIETIRELRVFQAEQMQNRGVQVVDGHDLLFRLETEFIAGADRQATLDSRSGHPYRHRTRVVIAADASLRDRHAAELAVPHDQSGIQQTARF